jgi:hypothetical protein
MNRGEILQELRSIEGRCSAGQCSLTENCELAGQAASDLNVDGKTDVLDNPGYALCPKRETVVELVGEFQSVKE